MNELESLWCVHMVKTGHKLARLERNGDVAIYQTWRKVERKNNFYNEDICYHVWSGKRWICLQDYREAADIYYKWVEEEKRR